MRVLIVEDQALLRAGLVGLFSAAGHTVVADRADAAGLAVRVAGHRPDLVVLDVRMPPTFTDEGARAAREIKAAAPEVGVLILSQHIETAHVVALAPLGGFGYLLKDRVLDVDEFLGAAARVAAGGSALDPQVVAKLLAGRDPHDGPLARLSDREREVLELVAEGRTNTGIAAALHVSERTVESHIGRVFAKLDIPSEVTDHRRVLAVLKLRGQPA